MKIAFENLKLFRNKLNINEIMQIKLDHEFGVYLIENVL